MTDKSELVKSKKIFQGDPLKSNSRIFGTTPRTESFIFKVLSVENNKPKSQFLGVAEHVAEDITKKPYCWFLITSSYVLGLS